MSKIDLIEKAYQKDDCLCEGQWLACANQVLGSNGFHPKLFVVRVRTFLSKWRGKVRNVIIAVPAKCGKTLLLRPLEVIFKTFSDPANEKCGWVGADKVEVIFLNGFHWGSELIKWNEFFLLLEGHNVYLPPRKNYFASDISIDKDALVFAASKDVIKFIGKYNTTDEIMARV